VLVTVNAVNPWDRTLQDRWDDVHRFLRSDWTTDGPGSRLVEAVEALVDEWHLVVVLDLVAEIKASPRLAATVASCDFDDRVPEATVELLRATAE
jgi:hypothetical protein